ncbi:MAG: hypothetical protein RL722_1060 [Pseudomonadota bacterium]|jgi:hypothetical protein
MRRRCRLEAWRSPLRAAVLRPGSGPGWGRWFVSSRRSKCWLHGSPNQSLPPGAMWLRWHLGCWMPGERPRRGQSAGLAASSTPVRLRRLAQTPASCGTRWLADAPGGPSWSARQRMPRTVRRLHGVARPSLAAGLRLSRSSRSWPSGGWLWRGLALAVLTRAESGLSQRPTRRSVTDRDWRFAARRRGARGDRSPRASSRSGLRWEQPIEPPRVAMGRMPRSR